VIKNAMDKTLVVRVDRRIRHERYSKEITRSKNLYAHDENNEAGVGDLVRVMETRPLSKLKRWRLVDILRKAEI
jgi:small subunit ribosomal protein S17